MYLEVAPVVLKRINKLITENRFEICRVKIAIFNKIYYFGSLNFTLYNKIYINNCMKE